jgi:DnaJ domain
MSKKRGSIMVDHYEVLGLSNNASSEEIKKKYRSLALIYHPDKSKNPKSARKFIEIAEAYEALYNEVKENEKREIQDDFTSLSIEPGKVSLSSLNTHSFVELRYEYGSVFGTLRTSLDRQFSVVFSDGYLDSRSDPPRWISGKVFLIEKDNLLWIKEIERPTNAAVSDNGTVALLYSLYRDSASLLSSKEFFDLGGTLAVIEKSGKTLFTYDFGSNIEGCAITRDGNLVSVGTLYPDNSVYCFYVGEKKELSWKYKGYNRKNAAPGLEFRGKGLLWEYRFKSHPAHS